ncbi:Tol-Pal system beta propeller repeat protein TolB [Thiomonas sp.]|uniref:Tol-Pal system beta propeller repeat protein TolB n=1 Tax=Thiomonas sp. TaxID=2047785 RepID=UPI0026293B50|nr:Tol-Pal system beta propeller repeat protein TolB [Thiomonas sp.]
MQRRRFVLGSLAAPLARGAGVLAGLSVLAAPARAQFKVDVSGIGATQIPVGIGVFRDSGNCPQPIADIVRADLTRSGLFAVSNLGGQTLTEQGPPNYAAWRTQNLEAVAGGSVTPAASGRWLIQFRLWDAVKQADLGGLALTVLPGDLRLAAHKISDYIYQKLTGQRGVFATRIAYISKAGPHNFALNIADSDGANPQYALRSREPLLSPVWSPNGQELAYVSFETGKPVVFVQNVRSGARRMVANFKGSNSAPAFSPDGGTMAVVLTLTGRSQIYLLPSSGGTPRQLMRSYSIDTEPVFAPDGQSLYFVSDRDGGPQVYKVALDGSGVQRITYTGGYNVSPAVSPDGKTLAYISQQGNSYQLWSINLATSATQLLDDGSDCGHPSFAPNGQIVLYSAGGRGGEVLKTVSIDGRVRSTLSQAGVQVREPSWGPWTPDR